MKSLSEAARNARARRKQYVKYQEGAELYSMGVTQFKRMAHECDSIIKIGRSAWWIWMCLTGIFRHSNCEKEEKT